mgnify:FL=1
MSCGDQSLNPVAVETAPETEDEVVMAAPAAKPDIKICWLTRETDDIDIKKISGRGGYIDFELELPSTVKDFSLGDLDIFPEPISAQFSNNRVVRIIVYGSEVKITFNIYPVYTVKVKGIYFNFSGAIIEFDSYWLSGYPRFLSTTGVVLKLQ